MTNLTLSRRYAKALLAIGREDGNLEKYREELDVFSQALEDYPDLYKTLTNPAYPAKARREVLVKVLAGSGCTTIVGNFLLLVQDKNRMGYLPEIADVYRKAVEEISGIVRAQVTAPTELHPRAKEQVKATLEKLTGKEIVLETFEDPDLIGGLVARVGDLVLDGSIKTQLDTLTETLRGVG